MPTSDDVEMAPPRAAVARPAVDFDQFFTAVGPSMLRLAVLMVGSREVAEDIVQESFVRVYERWDHVVNPGGYMRVVVINRCRSWHRFRGRAHRRRMLGDLSTSHDDRTIELADLLARLPHRRRAMVVLRFFEQLSTREIATAMNVSEGTVKSTIHRALAQLRQELT
jgi:RNA polymerase sigma-70 factor (sigma-E family)